MLKNCKPIPGPNGKCYCPVCDPLAKRPIPCHAKRNCRGKPGQEANSTRENAAEISEEPSKVGLAELVRRYVQALKRWRAAGYPCRSDEEVAWLFDHYCRGCKWHKNGSCIECGCRVAPKGMAVRNKIKMATETCPRGKWPARTEAGPKKSAETPQPAEQSVVPDQQPAARATPSSKPLSVAAVSQAFLGNLFSEGLPESAQPHLDAVRRWTSAGMPVRSTAEVRQLFARHCQQCRHRVGDQCQLAELGVYSAAPAWQNMLAMATESCPLDLWQMAPPTNPDDQPPLIQIAVGVVTAPRPGPPLTGRCWDSLRSAGFEAEDILVFAEPGTPDPRLRDGSMDVVWRGHRYGEWRNWIYSLRELLNRRPWANAVMMVQDDTLFLRHVRDWLEASLWPSALCGAVQVYTSRGYRHQPRGISRVEGRKHRWLLAACATIFPRPIAEKIVKYGLTAGWRGHTVKEIEDPARKEGVDTFIGQALRSVSRELWVHNPTLVKHDSDQSSLDHGPADMGFRASLDFPGLDADPFNLFAAPQRRFRIE